VKRTILVIGGLAAGPSAAAKAKRTNPDADVVVFEQGEYFSYGICEIPYVISGEIQNASHLTPFTPQTFYEKKGVSVKLFHRVEKIIPTKKILVVRNLARGEVNEFKYTSLVLATGSSPKKLGCSGENSRNVFFIKTLDACFALTKYCEENVINKAVIIGGGYVGMEMAESLRKKNYCVTILHKHHLPLRGLEEELREMVRAQLEKFGVEFIPNVTTEGFLVGKNETVTHVFTNRGTFEADIVIVSLGVEPNVMLAKPAKIRLGKSGGITTDSRQQTSVENIFVAGDCCEVKNLVTHQPMLLPLATLAHRQGKVAGDNAAGGHSKYAGAIRAIALRLFDKEIAHVGISYAEAMESRIQCAVHHISSTTAIPFMHNSKDISIIGIFEKHTGRILGANLMGGEGTVQRANTLAVAIQHKLTAQQISDLDLAYAPQFSPLWDAVLALGNTARKRLMLVR
jgi:NADPH-dependent 2,4-dienoyl-CoA reductase/sulfur reductase-like enzyme